MWRQRGNGRRGRPAVEGLESRRLLSATYTVYPLASPNSQPTQITVGPDGNLWFTEQESVDQGGTSVTLGAIGRINPTTGAISEHPLGVNNSAPDGLLFTPDGNLWFADPGNRAIGLYNPVTGYLIEFATPLAGSTPERVALGPDGNVWFTDRGGDAVGEINPATHAIKEYPLPRLNEGPFAIVAGPDGDLWFTEFSTGQIASIDPTTHAIAEYSLNTAIDYGPYPVNITVGPGGNLAYTAQYNVFQYRNNYSYDVVGTFNPITHAHAEIGSIGYTSDLTSGPQGDLWFQFGQVNPTTKVITSDTGPTSRYPYNGGFNHAPILGGIVTGPDGNVWSLMSGQVVKATPIPLSESIINGNVARDPIVGQAPLAGQTVYVDLKGDGKLDPGDPSAVTDASGDYTLGPIAPGTVTLRVVGYPGNTVVSPAGGGQSVAAVGGQIVQAAPFSLATLGSTLPLTFNPAPFGTHNPDVQTAEVNGLYQTILGRAPDSVGGAAAVAALKGGTPLSAVASSLLHSAEYFSDLAASDYGYYLGRAPAPAEVRAVVSALQGGLGIEQLAEDLLSSAEFNASHPTVASFVQAVYADILGRLPSSGELSAVEGLIAGGLGRGAVAQAVVVSVEADDLLVANVYAAFLDRAGDPTGTAFWVNGLQAGADPLLVAVDFASSAEFAQRANKTVG